MFRLFIDITVYTALFAIFLFRPAHTFHWWRAWVLLAVLFTARIISSISVTRVNQKILKERAKFPIQSGQPFTDKILVTIFMGSFAALVAFASFDVFQFRIFPAPVFFISS